AIWYSTHPRPMSPTFCSPYNFCPVLSSKHLPHLQYRQFKKQGFPIGSGMVESACKWLIEQRFKGSGMRWSEAGFNHLLHLRLAWVNRRFDPLFAEHPLTLHLYSPNH
ncbi:MAG: ISKra4-like element ISLesp2 family transposase, partial [Leptodesmis sp.]